MDVVGVVRPGSGLFVVRIPYDFDQGVFSAELLQGPRYSLRSSGGMEWDGEGMNGPHSGTHPSTCFFFFDVAHAQLMDGFDGTPEGFPTSCQRLPHSPGGFEGVLKIGCMADRAGCHRTQHWQPFAVKRGGMSERASRRSRSIRRLPIPSVCYSRNASSVCDLQPDAVHALLRLRLRKIRPNHWTGEPRRRRRRWRARCARFVCVQALRSRWTPFVTTPTPRTPGSVGRSAIKSREDVGAKPGLCFKSDAGRVTRILAIDVRIAPIRWRQAPFVPIRNARPTRASAHLRPRLHLRPRKSRPRSMVGYSGCRSHGSAAHPPPSHRPLSSSLLAA